MGRGASAAVALIIGTVEISDLRVSLIEVEMQVVPAIGTDQQAGKHILLALVGSALADFAPFLLNLLPHGAINNRLMDIFENHPIFTVVFDSLGRRLLLAFSGTLDTLFQPVGPWGQNFLPLKLSGNLLRSHAIQGHTVDTLDHLGGLIVYDPVFGAIRVFHIAIGRLAHRLARIALDLIADSALFGNVPRVPFVEQVADRGKLVIASIKCPVCR